VRDENGVQLDPSDANQISELKIWIYNTLDGTIVAKFYLNTLPSGDGWRQAVIKSIGAGDIRVLFSLTAVETEAAHANRNEIEIEITIPDTDIPPDNKRIIIQTGRFPDIKISQIS
jgi:ABC-type Zn uptake system ZnuABC Zn-binding protein ZnuA